MRILLVVQRYGHEVFGGAEYFSREFATRLAGRGHEVDVVTTCAVSYVDWANFYPAGTSEIDGVTVHRLPVVAPRDDRLFNGLNVRALTGHRPNPLYIQREWMRMQGPLVPQLRPWIEQHAVNYDVAAFYTYLYYTTWAGLASASALLPTVLFPTAHDEPPLYLPLFSWTFRLPRAFGFLTPEEAMLVHRRFGVRRPNEVVGVGVDLDVRADEARFRSRFGLTDTPYLVYVGRLDPHKGCDELFDYFRIYKERNPGALKLVLIGEPVRPLPDHPDVVKTGFVDEATKHDGMAGAIALVHPSYYESFSLVLSEAWTHRVPGLVQGRSPVLNGQARRSGGAIPYAGFAEFEAGVDLLVGDETLRRSLGRAGRAYVEANYEWEHVLDSYERLLDRVAVRTRIPAR